jgi:hypothetical protein
MGFIGSLQVNGHRPGGNRDATGKKGPPPHTAQPFSFRFTMMFIEEDA